MAIGDCGDVVSFDVGGVTHYGVVLDKDLAGTQNTVAYKLGAKMNQIEWGAEAVTSSVTVLSGSDALHG